ncbi:PIR protein CIR protein [Plasmodium vinckei brucechwatti]|uniref:PIR protein CIR protein n=1 Tax=Plasmodium vinckei brucechwatti TaxID=119398 RepID=A0A6V7RV16_PLAVN|nr:PIR protein CIR protein [Plasmodium vinckei brucechwatti]
MNDKTCDLLSEVDNLFTRGTVNAARFNKFTECHSYCPYQNGSKENECTNDYERINALGSYLFNKISEINKDFKGATGDKRHIEVFMMWLGDKLFKIENDYKATLEESYEKNLKKIMGNVKYWEGIDSKKLYKRATIKKMNELYNLLSHICKLIIEYNTNIQNPKKHNRKRLGNYSAQCISHYRAIISSANGCKPYLQLLDSLKMIYENFRMYKIDYNNNIKEDDKKLLLNRIQNLTTFEKENKYLLGVIAKISFDDKECKEAKSKDEQIGEKILQNKPKDTALPKKSGKGPQTKLSPSAPQGKPRPPAHVKPPTEPRLRLQPQPQPIAPGRSPDQPQKPGPPPTSPSASSQKDTKLKTPQAGEPHQNGPGGPGDEKKDINSGLDSHGGSGTPVGTGGGQRSPNSGTGDSVNGQGSGQDNGKDSKEGIGGGKSEQGSTSSGARGGQGSQRITNSESGGADGGLGASKGGQKALDRSKGNKGGGTDDGANGGAGTPGSGVNGGGITQGDQGNPSGGLSNQGNPSVGSNDQGDKSGGLSDPASNTSGGSFDLWSPFREFILNGTEIYNKTFQFIKENQQRLNDAKDQISNAYDSAVNNLKSAYSVSSSYFSDIISNISSQFNQVGTPPKPGNSGNSPPQNNDQSQKNGGPSSSPTKDPPPKDPQSNSIPTTSKDPSQLPPQLSSSPTPQQPQQSFSQPQPTTHQNPQAPAQVNQPNSQKIGQLVKSLSSDIILKKTWNIFPTTWNGSGDCKPEIKFMNATLVCCTSEQCSLTGILITIVLIPIILSIAYKYLSFGSSKKSEKKNMKKVINFHDGNRKTKIIISSNDRNKDLKPVINSVGAKKDSLINIYKIIQADPMPFINLFFLLIFFVYKRKRDTIE